MRDCSLLTYDVFYQRKTSPFYFFLLLILKNRHLFQQSSNFFTRIFSESRDIVWDKLNTRRNTPTPHKKLTKQVVYFRGHIKFIDNLFK